MVEFDKHRPFEKLTIDRMRDKMNLFLLMLDIYIRY